MPVRGAGRHVQPITRRRVRAEMTCSATKTHRAFPAGPAPNVLGVRSALVKLQRGISGNVAILTARVLEHGADCLECRGAFRAGGRRRQRNSADCQNDGRAQYAKAEHRSVAYSHGGSPLKPNIAAIVLMADLTREAHADLLSRIGSRRTRFPVAA